MDPHDKMVNPARTIARSVLIIIWWVCIWGLTEIIIHHISIKSTLHKVVFYAGLMLLILGTIGLDPHMLHHI